MFKKILLFIFVIILLSNTIFASDLTSNALFHFTNDDANTSGTTMLNDAPFRDGKLINTVTTGLTGKLGQSYQIGSTNSYLDLNGSNGIDLINGNFTINMWVKGCNRVGDYTWGGSYFFASGEDGKTLFDIRGNSSHISPTRSREGIGYDEIPLPIPYDNSTWTMITVIYGYQNSRTLTYINGVLLSNTSFTAGNGDSAYVNANTSYIGTQVKNNQNYLNTQVDEISIYTDSLTTSQISELYNSGSALNPFNSTPLAPSAPQMILNMTFDGNINDTSGNLINSSYYNNGLHGYDFALNQNSNDIFSTLNGIDTGITYSNDGASCVRSESDYIDLGNVTINDQSFTWFIEFRNDIHGNNLVLISNGGYDYGGLELEFDNINQLHITQINGTGAGADSYENSQFSLTTSVLNMNKLTIVYNNKNVTVYQNGAYMGSHLYVGDISYVDTAQTYLCRRQFPGSEQYGDYTIKKFLAYDRVLTPTEILALNNSGNYVDDKNSNPDSAFFLNGSEWLEINYTSIPDLQNFTVSVWFNSKNYTGSASGDGNIKNNLWSFTTRNRLMLVNGSLSYEFYSGAFYKYYTLQDITLDTWSNVILTKNTNDGLNIYLDGSLLFQNTSEINLIEYYPPFPITFGSRRFNEFFNGSIDELNIWNYALNDTQVLSLYESQLGGVSITTNLSTQSLHWPNLNWSVNVSLWNNGWNESPTCEMIENADWVTCSPSTSVISLDDNETFFNCGAEEKNTGIVSVYAQCSSDSHDLINSTTYYYSITADSNPLVYLDNLSNSTENSFDILAKGINISENFYCEILDTSAYITCTDIYFTSNNTEYTYNVTSCSVSQPISEEVYFMLSCDGSLYNGINSTNTSIIIDTLNPTINVTSPNSSNKTWNYINNTFSFAATCSHSSPVNVSQFNVTCVNETGDVMFTDNQTYNSGTISYTNTTSEFNYVNIFMCQFECVDSFGLLTSIYQNISTIEMNISKSNISDTKQSNGDFSLNVPFDFNGDTANCSLIANDTTITCGNYLGTTPALYNCTTPSAFENNVTFIHYCNSTTRPWINNTVTLTSAGIFVDKIDPSITINYWEANKTYFRENITGNFTFKDNSSLFSWNVTIDGVQIDGATNPSYNEYYYNLSIDPSNYATGQHTLFLRIADGHTAKEIPDYTVKKGTVFDDSYLTFKTPDGNQIEISAEEQLSGDKFSVTKEFDRYTFEFEPEKDLTREDIAWSAEPITYKTIDDSKTKIGDIEPEPLYKKIEFKVKCKENIYIVERPNSKWKEWLVCGNQWIDFYSDYAENDIVNYYYDLSLNEPYKNVKVEVFYNGDLNEPIKFQSVGDLNIVNYTTTFYTVNLTTTYTSSVPENTETNINLRINTSGTPVSFDNFTAVLTYNNTITSTSKTSATNYVNWLGTPTTPELTTTENVSFYWNISYDGEDDYILNLNQTVTFIGISDNCSTAGYVEALKFCGYQERSPTNNITDMLLNLNIDVLDDGEIIKQFGFNFDNSTCYDICIFPNTTSYKINAKMEFGDGNYTDRKYYLNNYSLDNSSDTINLYHLEDSLASDIILTVYDKQTGDRVSDAFIKILRYYPQDDNSSSSGFKTVEVEKTDVNGESLGKMILADVWYKFLIEYPVGTIIFDGDIEKILTTDKLLPVSLSTGNLLSYNEIYDINTDLDCNWLSSPPQCTFTWSNPSGSNVIGSLKIFQETGFKKNTVYENSITSSAASITYQITENTTNKKYLAQGWIDT